MSASGSLSASSIFASTTEMLFGLQISVVEAKRDDAVNDPDAASTLEEEETVLGFFFSIKGAGSGTSASGAMVRSRSGISSTRTSHAVRRSQFWWPELCSLEGSACRSQCLVRVSPVLLSALFDLRTALAKGTLWVEAHLRRTSIRRRKASQASAETLPSTPAAPNQPSRCSRIPGRLRSRLSV